MVDKIEIKNQSGQIRMIIENATIENPEEAYIFGECCDLYLDGEKDWEVNAA